MELDVIQRADRYSLTNIVVYINKVTIYDEKVLNYTDFYRELSFYNSKRRS